MIINYRNNLSILYLFLIIIRSETNCAKALARNAQIHYEFDKNESQKIIAIIYTNNNYY